MNSNLKMSGIVKITLRAPDGSIKERTVKNTVVTTGKQLIAGLIANAGVTHPTHMALGTDSTVVDPALDTTLGAEIVNSREETPPAQGLGGDANKITYIGSWGVNEPSAGTHAIAEAGLFNSVSGGTMLARTVFDVKNKGANDTLTITWEITVGP